MKTSTTYNSLFWNSLKKGGTYHQELREGFNSESGTYFVPNESTGKLTATLAKGNLFRRYATVKNATTSDGVIWIKSSNANVKWLGNFDPIPEAPLNPEKIKVVSHKLASISVLQMDFMRDNNFNIEDYITGEFALCFGRVEEEAFINGDGVDKPIGILNETNGAEVGVATNSIAFDDVIKLFFSVESEYRNNAIWVMNDETAQNLYSLKDNNGNYLWRGSFDTLLGRPVVISNHMPSVGEGTKPIAFGDFKYYWVIQRQPLSVKALVEKYTLNDEMGFIGFERLDGKLIKNEAIKVLKINN